MILFDNADCGAVDVFGPEIVEVSLRPRFLRGSTDGVTFENVRIFECQATNAADLNLTFEGDVKERSISA